MEVAGAPAAAAGRDRPAPGTMIVFWDGQCPFCGAIKQRISAFDTHHLLHFVDLNDPAVALSAAPRFTPEELRQEMRTQMPNGAWRTGYFAWAAVIKALPAFSGIGSLMQLWVFADAGPRFYRWVADHRYQISKLLRLPEPCAADGACRIDLHQG